MGKNKKNRNRDKKSTVAAIYTPSTQPKPESFPVPVRIVFILCLLVAAWAAFLYAGSYHHDFAYDDLAVIKENRFVQKGTDGISDMMRTQYFEGYDPSSNARAYRPVSLITYAIEYEYFGLNPRVHHLVNILLYSLTAVVLLLVLLKMLRAWHWLLAVATTLLFVVHPVHVDVVANIKSRDELLGFLFFSLALFSLLAHLDAPRWWKKLLSLAFFFLALASKESLIPTVACIPLVLYFFRGMKTPALIRQTLPYAGVFLVFLLIRASVLSGADSTSSQMTYLDNPILAAQNWNERAGTTLYSLGLYLKTLGFPYKLSCDYSYNSIPVTGMDNPAVLLSLAAYVFLGFVAVKGFRKRTIFSFCAWWFFITISIVSSVFIIASNAYADRFLYTPSLAVCLAAAFALYKLAGITQAALPRNPVSGKAGIAGAILLVLLVAASIRTLRYVPVWKNDMTLFAYNLKVNPQNARMHKNYGGEMVRQAMAMRSDTSLARSGDTATINNLARRGIAELQIAKAIYPRDAIGHIHEGNAHILLGNFAEAETSLRNALAIHHSNRFAIMSLGYVLYTTGRYQEAAATWEQIDPSQRSAGDHYNLYLAYMMMGDQSRANYYKQLSGR